MRSRKIKRHSNNGGCRRPSRDVAVPPNRGMTVGNALQRATVQELAHEIATRTKAVIAYTLNMENDEPPCVHFTDSFPKDAHLPDVLRQLARFHESDGRDLSIYRLMDEGGIKWFSEENGAIKGYPVFTIHSENPDNIPAQSYKIEHAFQDKGHLCELLRKFIKSIEDEHDEIDLEVQGYAEAEREGKLQ